MKVKRFFAPTMPQALRLVREEMGADAVILSNRRVDGGVEIVTALNYNEGEVRAQLGVADPATLNSGRVAALQAEHHLRLENELGRARNRIRDVRDRSANRNAATGPAAQPDRAATAPASALVATGADAGQTDAWAEMRAEIHSLRELLQGRGSAEPQARPERTNLVQQRLQERLMDLGLGKDLSIQLAREHAQGRLDNSWKSALKGLAGAIAVEGREWMDRGGIYAVVGATGAGKTTTLGKLAARHVLRHGEDSVALITTDRYRVAAHEQLFVFGRILNVPVRVVDEENSLDSLLDELSDRHLVLIDTAGLNAGDRGWQEQMDELAQSRHPIQTYLLMAATSQPRIMKSTWHLYKMMGLAGCVITKLDEALTLGEALDFAVESHLSVAYYTDGQKIPQDLHRAGAGTLVKLAVRRLQALADTPPVLSKGA
jgi:flagellar biosynthesis protein FlhF